MNFYVKALQTYTDRHTPAKILRRRFAGGNNKSHKYSMHYSQTIYESECTVTASREAEESSVHQ